MIMKALGQLTTSIVALICLLPYVVLGQDLAPETNFTIVQNTPIDTIKEFWSVYPDQAMNKPKLGVYLTKPGTYQSSLFTYLKVTDMMRQFKVALAITFGETNPKPAVERSDEEYSKHADAVALILSPNPLPTQPPAEALDSIPVDGGVFFVVRGEKATYVTFRRFNGYSAASQRYIDLLYETARQHTTLKKHYSCEIKDSKFNTLFLKIMGNGTTGMLEVVYKTNNDRNDSPYNFCMNMSHYERYLGNHYFYPAIATKSPDERNTEIILNNAKLNYERVTIDFGFDGEIDQKLYDRLNGRLKSLDKVKTLPAKKLNGLLKLQKMISQRSEQLNHYVVDFQKGLHTLQEHFMTEIGQSKTKSGSDVKSLVDITNKLASLDIRQNRIFTKLANLHKKFAKHRGLDRVEQELLSLQVVIEDSVNKIEQRGLGQIVKRSEELTGIFKEIIENQKGFETLKSAKDLGITYKDGSTWSTILLSLGGLLVRYI